jgi:hypothetical protein
LHRVKVGGHATEGVNLPGCFLAGFVERLEEAAPVVIAFENGFVAVATIDDVVDRSRKLHAKLKRH